MQHKSILDPSFKYIPASQTDISKTFERVRAEMAINNAMARPVMFASIANVPDEELQEAAELLRQDYQEYGDPWYPRQKGVI